MILLLPPLLAGEGVLNGLRGEYRRIEDKFLSMGMELKNCQIPFDVSKEHGNRTGLVWFLFVKAQAIWKETFFCSFWIWRNFPAFLPCYMVLLDRTLGSRLGTLYKAPRDSERDVKDSNCFCRNAWWSVMGCERTTPLPTSDLELLVYHFLVSHKAMLPFDAVVTAG